MDARLELIQDIENRKFVEKELEKDAVGPYRLHFMRKALRDNFFLYIEARYKYNGKQVKIKETGEIGVILDVEASPLNHLELRFTIETADENYALQDFQFDIIETTQHNITNKRFGKSEECVFNRKRV